MSLSRSVVHSVAASTDPMEEKRFTFGQLAGLFQVYALSGSAKGVSIRGYKLSSAACAEVGVSIRTLKRKLSLMDFAYCPMGDQGAINIMRALADAQHGGEVHELVLRLCRLSPDFGREVGRIFFHGSGRTSSGLKDNGIRPFGNLRALDLSFNALGCAGVASVIRHAPAGLQLDMSFTGLDIDACTNLNDLDSALNNTEASSILLFGAGEAVTAHLFRQRHLSQTRKERQQVVDAKCLLAAEDPDDIRTVTNNSATDGSSRADLQFCRFGGPSVTLYLDGDLQTADPQECTATQEYLMSDNTETAPWSTRLLREIVAFVGEPIFNTPSYRVSKNYPAFVRGEIAGVYRVRDGRNSSVFSARSASCITQRSNSPMNNNSNTARRSGSVRSIPSRSNSPNSFSNTFNKSQRSASAQSLVRTASRPDRSGSVNSASYNNNNNNATDRSTSIISVPEQNHNNHHSPADHDDPNGRTASVLSTLTTTTTNLCKPMFRTPFERDAPPMLNCHKNKNDTQEQQDKQRELTTMLSPRSPSVMTTNATVATIVDPSEGIAGSKSNNSRKRNSIIRDVRPFSVDMVSTHLSPRTVVKAGRQLKAAHGPTLLIIKDMTAFKKQQLLEQLLRACVVSDSQAEKIFGLASIREYLGPNCLPPLSFSQSSSTLNFSSTLNSTTATNELNNSNNNGSSMSEEQVRQQRQALGNLVPPVLFQANGTPSWLIKQPAGSEQRVAGIAKILFYLIRCDLPEQEDIEWITKSNVVDLPEFLRHFGDTQRTVIQFRSQRKREDQAARAIADALIASCDECITTPTFNNSGNGDNNTNNNSGNNNTNNNTVSNNNSNSNNDDSLVIG